MVTCLVNIRRYRSIRQAAPGNDAPVVGKLPREPLRRSTKAPRRRDQRDARLFKAGEAFLRAEQRRAVESRRLSGAASGPSLADQITGSRRPRPRYRAGHGSALPVQDPEFLTSSRSAGGRRPAASPGLSPIRWRMGWWRQQGSPHPLGRRHGRADTTVPRLSSIGFQ